MRLLARLFLVVARWVDDALATFDNDEGECWPDATPGHSPRLELL